MSVLMLNLAALVTAAFSLVAALAWNYSIKVIFKEVFEDSNVITPMLIYASMATIIEL